MSLSMSKYLANQILTGGSMKGALDAGFLYLYSGPVPANADAAASGATKLAKITKDGDGSTGLTFATPAANGVIVKTAAEVWECLGADLTSGTVAFYRYCVGADDGSGASGAGNYRVQGTVGIDASFDLIVPTTTLTHAGADFGPINTFQWQMPLV